jgi:hypothetical protein
MTKIYIREQICTCVNLPEIYSRVISYRPQLQADVFAVLFMNELKSLTNIVVGKLDKLGLHRSINAEKEKRYYKHWSGHLEKCLPFNHTNK